MREVTVSICAVGDSGAGKTLCIHEMTKALSDKFHIVAQQPSMQHIKGVEVYTFRICLKQDED